jgi:hypothetical protein
VQRRSSWWWIKGAAIIDAVAAPAKAPQGEDEVPMISYALRAIAAVMARS